MPIISTNISHTTKAHSILSTLSTPALRRYASRKSSFYGLSSGTDSFSIATTKEMNARGFNSTTQDDFAQKLVSFYDHATTHFHSNGKSMLQALSDGDRIFWNSYK